MSAFNILIIHSHCPFCHNPIDLRLQFKYGDTWQHEYIVGDSLKWGGERHRVYRCEEYHNWGQSSKYKLRTTIGIHFGIHI